MCLYISPNPDGVPHPELTRRTMMSCTHGDGYPLSTQVCAYMLAGIDMQRAMLAGIADIEVSATYMLTSTSTIER